MHVDAPKVDVAPDMIIDVLCALHARWVRGVRGSVQPKRWVSSDVVVIVPWGEREGRLLRQRVVSAPSDPMTQQRRVTQHRQATKAAASSPAAAVTKPSYRYNGFGRAK